MAPLVASMEAGVSCACSAVAGGSKPGWHRPQKPHPAEVRRGPGGESLCILQNSSWMLPKLHYKTLTRSQQNSWDGWKHRLLYMVHCTLTDNAAEPGSKPMLFCRRRHWRARSCIGTSCRTKSQRHPTPSTSRGCPRLGHSRLRRQSSARWVQGTCGACTCRAARQVAGCA